jgi:hypothetical protein
MKLPSDVKLFIENQLKNGVDYHTLYYMVKEKYESLFEKFPSFTVFQREIVRIKNEAVGDAILAQPIENAEFSTTSNTVSSIEEILKLKNNILETKGSTFNKKEALELLISTCISRIHVLDQNNRRKKDVRIEQLINRYLAEVRQIIIEMTKLQVQLQQEIGDEFQKILNNTLVEFLLYVIAALKEVYGTDERLTKVFNLVLKRCSDNTNLKLDFSNIKVEDLVSSSLDTNKKLF